MAASLPESIEDTNEELVIPLLDPDQEKGKGNASWPITIVTLLSLQLGWGLWYCPLAYAPICWRYLLLASSVLRAVGTAGCSQQTMRGWAGCQPAPQWRC